MRVLALFALLPIAALAQTPTSEPIDVPVGAPAPSAAGSVAAAGPAAAAATPALPREANWSIGAGLSFETTYVSPVYVASLGGVYLQPVQTPSVAASLERRLARRTWLVLGLNGSAARDRQDLEPGQRGVSKTDYQTLAVAAGVRHVLTPAGAFADVSALVLAEGGVSSWDDEIADSYGIVPPIEVHQSAWRAGASFGLAIDRELTHGLSLRIATPLLAASYTSTRMTVTGEPRRDGETTYARAVIAPRLELRLAF